MKIRRYTASVFRNFGRPQVVEHEVMAYDIADAWIQAERKWNAKTNGLGDYTTVMDIRPDPVPVQK